MIQSRRVEREKKLGTKVIMMWKHRLFQIGHTVLGGLEQTHWTSNEIPKGEETGYPSFHDMEGIVTFSIHINFMKD